MFSIESFVYAWDNQLAYALALVNDLTDQQFILRPGGNMNHPAWILGHIAAYHPVTLQLLSGEPVDDPKTDPLFGFAGHGPLDDIKPYVSKQAMVSLSRTAMRRLLRRCSKPNPRTSTAHQVSNAGRSRIRRSNSCCLICFCITKACTSASSAFVRRAAGLPSVAFPNRASEDSSNGPRPSKQR